MQEAEKGTHEWQIGQEYASEALCLMGKSREATEHLQSALESVIEASSQPEEVRSLPYRRAQHEAL